MPAVVYRSAVVLGLLVLLARTAAGQSYLWQGYGQDPQHSSLSQIPSQSLAAVRWQETVDQQPQYAGNGDLYIHYGSPMIGAGNTIVAPVKTTAYGGFEIQGLNGSNGNVLWTQTSDYVVPPNPHVWTPPYSPTLTSSNLIYYPGADGTVYRANLASAGSVASTRLAFYGTTNYTANPSAYSNVYIDTPITSDAAGDIYFGYQVIGVPAIAALGSGGIARISANGVGTYVSAASATGDPTMLKAVENCAPAISNDGSSVYVAMNSTSFSSGYLVQLNSSTLATTSKVVPMDPAANAPALLVDDGTASPTIGPGTVGNPAGDVFFGVYDDAGTSRGWLEHYSADLATTKTPGGFGWDSTVSIVPAAMVPSYHGTSTYLLMSKFNNYIETGGGGQNMIAILDPDSAVIDDQRNNPTGATIMQTVLTQLGPTPNGAGGVYEWCDNDAVVDPATDSILVTSEDGHLYRWNLATNTFTESIALGGALGQAYTPTEIGPDGTVYATNNSTLYSIGLPITFWTGAAGSNWNAIETNWAGGSPSAGMTYADGAVVTFGDKDPLSGDNVPNSSGNVTIAIQGIVAPAWVTFTNTGPANGGVDYTIGGGSIGGTTGITLAGTAGVGGAVYLTAANSFTGGVAIDVGRLNLQDGLALGNSSGVLVGYGAALELQNTSASPMTFGLTATGSNPIPLALAGSGIGGAGALNSLAGNNTYGGPISIGLNSGGATIGSSSTAPGDLVTLSGGINVAPGATLTFIGAGNATISTLGPVLSAATADGSATLAKQGPGLLEITAAPTLGDGSALVVSGGILRFNVTSGTPTVGIGVTATISSNATLELAGSVSALGANQVNITNSPGAPGATAGLLVSGTGQQVGSITGNGNMVVNSAASLTAYQIVQHSLTINGTGTVMLLPSGSGSTSNPAAPNNINLSSSVAALSIGGTTDAWTGTLDIGNNGLVIAYGSGTDPYATISNMIKSGYANGNWTGTGITSSLARAAALLGSPIPALNIGLIDFVPNTGNFGSSITFEGQTITTSAILVRLTYMDDLVLAGDMAQANATSDALFFAANYGSGTVWSYGDITHDGVIDTNDALLFAANYVVGLPSLDGTTGSAAALGRNLTAVPEPASVAMALLAASGTILAARHGRGKTWIRRFAIFAKDDVQ